MERRLRRLDVRWGHVPDRPGSRYDVTTLAADEQAELDAILATVEALPPRSNGRPDLSPLSDAELERLDELAQRIRVKETP